jgi:hypothetical protein
MQTDPLELICRTAPAWFTAHQTTADTLEGAAKIAVAFGAGDVVVELLIRSASGRISVSEFSVGTLFPARCSERHVQWDGTFCIGYQAGEGISTADAATVWWGLLEQFLRLQRVASRTRRWPVRQAVAHGAAGPHHLAALQAARELGLEEEYYRTLEGEPAWFSGQFPRVNTTATKLLNGRLPCPKGCTKMGKPILRRNCTKAEVVCRLLSQERLRQKTEREFWQSLIEAGTDCCGTMEGCPLRVM